MALTQVTPAYPVFTDKSGDPLDAGYVYIGTVNLNPETNPIQVFWDDTLTTPAAQPIRTLGGYPSRNGTPSQLYANSDYSITVKDKRSAIVFYAAANYSVEGRLANYLLLAGGTLTGAVNEAQGGDIPSSGSVNLTAATGNYVHITGTTSITAITLAQGAERTVVFDGVLTLVNGASLLLPTGENIITAAGDVAVFRGEAIGVVRCVGYMRKNGSPLRTPDTIDSISASVGSNILTLTYNGGTLDFRNATLASGVPISGVIVPSNSIVVPATATLGTASGVPSRLVLLEAYNGGTPVACVVNLAGTAKLDETDLISPTTISAGSTSANTIYSASAVGANSPYRIVGFIDNQQATAGLWASSPTKIQGMGGQARAALLPLPRQYVALALAGTPARDFNPIPPNVDEITCVIQGLSTVGTSIPIIQVGTASGGVINTGYTGSTGVTSASTAASVNHSSGILIEANTNAAASVRTGQLSLRRLGEGSNTWVYTGIMGNSDGARINYIAGSIALSEALNKVRITTVGGLDDMDAGSFNVYYTYRGA